MILFGFGFVLFFVLICLQVGNYSYVSSFFAMPGLPGPPGPSSTLGQVCSSSPSSSLYTVAVPNTIYYIDGNSTTTSKHYQFNLPPTCTPNQTIQIKSLDSSNIINSGIWKNLNIPSMIGKNVTQFTSSADGEIVYASIWGDYIYRSIDSGSSWSPLLDSGIRNWISVSCSISANVIWALEYNGSIYLSQNNGTTFTKQINSPLINESILWLKVASSFSGNAAIFCAFRSDCFYTVNLGSTWSKLFNLNSTVLHNGLVWGASFYYISTDKGLFTSSDGFVRFTNNTFNLVLSSGGTILYGTENGYLIYSVDNALTWTNYTTSLNGFDSLVGSLLSSTTVFGIFIAQISSKLFISFDNANTWYEQTGTLAETAGSIANTLYVTPPQYTTSSIYNFVLTSKPIASIFVGFNNSVSNALRWKNLQYQTNQRDVSFVCQTCGKDWIDSTSLLTQTSIVTNRFLSGHFAGVALYLSIERSYQQVQLCWSSFQPINSSPPQSLTATTIQFTIPANFRSTIYSSKTSSYTQLVTNFVNGSTSQIGLVTVDYGRDAGTLTWQKNAFNLSDPWPPLYLYRVEASCVSYSLGYFEP